MYDTGLSMAHELYNYKNYCITVIMSNIYYNLNHSKHIVFSEIDVQKKKKKLVMTRL